MNPAYKEHLLERAKEMKEEANKLSEPPVINPEWKENV